MIKLNKKLILASNSPRRREILTNAGFEFEIWVKNVEEIFPEKMEPIEVPQFLAEKKALVFEPEIGDVVVLTADTIVVVDNEILNKPANEVEAMVMLKKLSGRTHYVHTGVCIYTGNSKNTFVDTTEVRFKPLTDREITYYIKTCKPYDKAGGYGVQDFIGMVGIDEIRGSYFNVMGLPIHRVYQELGPFIDD